MNYIILRSDILSTFLTVLALLWFSGDAVGRRRRVRGFGEAGSPESLAARSIQYGLESPTTIAWDDAAAARMKKIPAFVRGMVVRAVEDSCRKSGLDRVTIEELERIRARMPTPKFFG